MEIFKEDLNEFQVLEEIPKNLLDEIVERTSNYFDNFISSRMEMKTLANMKTSPEKRTKKRKLNQNIPDEIASIYQRAHESYLDDDFDLAIKLATEAKNILPSAPEPYSLLASISEELGSLEESLIYLEKAVRLSSDSSEIWIEYSKLSKDLGRISDSATCLKRAIRSNPENINSLLELQELLEGEIEDPRKKLFCLTELNKRRPDNPEYARQLALYLHETGRIEDSLQVLQKHLDYQLNNQIEIDINNVNLLSRGYLNENQNGLVIKIDQIITEAPPDFRVNAACAYIRMKEIDKAKEKFELIYELSPLEFSDAYSIIVDELIKSSYFKEAINLLNRIQENGLESRKDLAFCYEMLQKPKKAVKILQDILLSDPLDSSVCSHFFFLMSHLGHETEIYDFVHKNCPECIQNEEMLFQISTNYLNSGNIDKYLSSSTVFFCRILYDLSLNQIQKHTPSAIKEILGLTNSEKITPLLLKVLKYKRFSKNLTIPEEEFRKLCSTSIHLYHDKHCAVETLVMSGLFCLLYPKKFDEYNTLFIFTLTSFKSGYSIEACTLMRSIILKNTDNYLVWKYFNHFIQSTPNEENSAYKFLTRAAVKLPFNPAIQIILGNHSQSTV